MRKLPTVSIKGKEYVMVKDRVSAFRELYPKYSLTTEIIELSEVRCVMRAVIKDENGREVADGIAYEVEGSSNINATSYIENCQTSAWGRACASYNIGIDDSIGSADEVANAILQQAELCSEAEKAKFIALAGGKDKAVEVLKAVGWHGGNMTTRHYADGVKYMQKVGMIE